MTSFIDYLRSAPEEQFDMSVFIGDWIYYADRYSGVQEYLLENPNCPRCLLGHYVTFHRLDDSSPDQNLWAQALIHAGLDRDQAIILGGGKTPSEIDPSNKADMIALWESFQ